MKKYDAAKVEAKWQKVWQQTGIYKTPKNPKKPFYNLVMFPYPSGDLHVGHWYNFAPADTLGRLARMQGHDVLQPLGYDAFGLPAENAAIKRNIAADEWTAKNVAAFREQYIKLGGMYDLDRDINTSDPDYYRWTQWLFLQLFKAGKAVQKEAYVNWDPVDKTVLANEQVINGHADRSGAKVERKLLKQWFFTITDYADDLIKGLDGLDWPERVKQQQINWIGKSHGSIVRFPVISSVIPDPTQESSSAADSLKFTPELTKQILAGNKFSTIRLEPKNLKKGDAVELITRFDPQTTQTFATAKVSKIETKKLSEIPLKLEGHDSYSSRQEMLTDYKNYYGQEVTSGTEFTIYYFENVTPATEILKQVQDDESGAGVIDSVIRSYIMGVEVIEGGLKQLGATVDAKNDDGNLSVTIPAAKLAEYEKLVGEKLQPGFWNEYVGADTTVFIFKHKDGKLERIVWSLDTEEQLLKLCNEFASAQFTGIYQMLNDNKFYAGHVPLHIDVYTTRIDTLYSGTFIVLAPEHPMVASLTTKEHKKEVEKYVETAGSKTDTDRLEAKEKTGVFTGSYVTNPASGEQMPVWIADFVLGSYGTGAVFADGHDERDVELAQKYGIPLKTSIDPVTGSPQDNPEDKDKIVAVVENAKGEILTVNWGPKLGGRLLVGGTIEANEDPLETAKREVAEETGYTDLEFVEMGDETIHHEYFAHSKGKPFVAHTKPVYFKLKSDKRQDQALEDDEKGKFKIEWVPKKLVEGEVTDPLHRYVYDKFILHKVFTGDGVLYNSGQFDGLTSAEARVKITEYLATKGLAKKATQYRLRDWLISRQRYWGTPIPIVYCDKCGVVPVPEKDLPVVLPLGQNFDESGRSPLLTHPDFMHTACPECGGDAKRETDTMDTFVDSSWYYLRYPNVDYAKGAFDPAAVKTWLPVDRYMGGVEHAILHLLYSRFITKFLHEQKLVDFDEPFTKLINQGIILGPDGNKMSKSKGNVIDPVEYLHKYGADALRLYLMFMGPYEDGGPWDSGRFEGTYRFVKKVWELVVSEYMETDHNSEIEAELETKLHKLVKKVGEDIGGVKFNTAISAFMEFVNFAQGAKQTGGVSAEVWKQTMITMVTLIAPLAPHLAEELWEHLGQTESVHMQAWPKYDPAKVKDDVVIIVVQVNGKLRGEFVVETGASKEAIEAEAIAQNQTNNFTKGAEIVKTIVVPGRLVNFVVKG